MKIDLHTHILPPRWPDLSERYGYAGFVHLKPCGAGRAQMVIGERVFREVDSKCWDPQRRLADCEQAGVDLQVLSTVPVMFSYWAKPADAAEVSRLLNDHVAQVIADHPGRFAGLGTIPMQDAELAVRELERCVAPASRGGLELAGVQIGTHVDANEFQGRPARNLNDPSVFPVFERAAQLGAAVFVHPWDMLGADRMPQYWLPWLVGMPAETSLAICSLIFGGVLERLPVLRVAFAHGGGAFPFTAGRVEHAFRVRPDLTAIDNATAPSRYLRQADGTPARFWVDSLTHDARSLRLLLEVLGPERVCLGSDYPFPLGEPRPGALIESLPELPAATRELLLSGAAREFLNAC